MTQQAHRRVRALPAVIAAAVLALASVAPGGWLGAAPRPAHATTPSVAYSLSPATATLAVGSTASLDLVASAPNGGLAGWTIDVRYDAAAVSVACTTPFGVCNDSYAVGVARMVGAAIPELTGTQTLGTLTFTGLQTGGPTTLTLTALETIDADVNDVATSTANGALTVTSAVWYVSGSGSDSNSCLASNAACATIDGAIAKATTGGIVTIAAGAYAQRPTISKSVTLQGAGAASTTLNGSAAGTVLTVNSGVTATVTGLTVTNGSASSGGGIVNNGTLTLTSSAITGNTASGSGGGIRNAAGTVTLLNSTVAANTSTGGSATGGNLHNEASFSIKNSIIASATAGGGCATASAASLTSQGNNLVSDSSCSGITPGGNGDLRNSSPLLGPLQDNGGPTFTHALLPGSPAINAGTNTGCPTSDQRGLVRSRGPFCDIGAFELQTSAINWLHTSVTLVSVPASWTHGQAQTVTVTFTNDGIERLPISGANPLVFEAFFLTGPLTQYPGQNWEQQTIFTPSLSSDLLPGQSATVTFSVAGPNSARCCTQLGFMASLKGRTAITGVALKSVTVN